MSWQQGIGFIAVGGLPMFVFYELWAGLHRKDESDPPLLPQDDSVRIVKVPYDWEKEG